MTAVLLDTHAWAWVLHRPDDLSRRASDAIERAEARLVSPISLFEVAQKARLGKWPEMVTYLGDLAELPSRQGIDIAPLSPAICVAAGRRDWLHRDPFDRLIAETAVVLDLPLVTRDPAFREIPDLTCIW